MAEKKIAEALLTKQSVPVGSLLAGEGFSEEDQAYAQAEQWARKMLADPRCLELFYGMVNLRQTYAIFYAKLQAFLAEMQAHPMTEDFLIQMAMFEAQKPFTGPAVLDAFPKTVLKVISSIVDRDIEAYQDENKKARRAEDEARRAKPLPWSFSLQDKDDLTWPRKMTFTLAGWRPAVRFIADEIANAVIASKEFAVLRLREDEVQKEDPIGSLNLHLGSKAWQGCCNSANDMMRMFFDYGRGLAHTPDLLICENMAVAYTRSFEGRRPGATAGDAHKTFRKWCDDNGCGLLGLLPSSSQEPPDTTAKEYEQLRTFSTVKRVLVRQSPFADTHYRLSLVGHARPIWDVPKEKLDQRETTKLIVPDFALST